MTRALLAAAAALLALTASPAAAAEARRVLDEGLTLFAAGQFEAAAGRFAEAAAQAQREGLDPAVATYDRAIALLRAGKGAAAAGAFTEALRSPDTALHGSAHYQRGIALTTVADAAESAGGAGEAVALLEQALEAYESAMRIDPGDEDPKVNHELVSRRKSQLEEKLKGQEKTGGDGARGGAKPEETERPRDQEPQGPGQGAPPARQDPAGQEMRPDEARTLLDAMRQQEQSQRGRTRPFRGEAVPVEKNW